MPGYADSIGDLGAINWAKQPGMAYFTLGATPLLIAPGNPMRVVLVMSAISAGSVVVGVDTSITTSKGIVLTASVPVIILTQQEHGLLVSLPWFAVAPGATTIAVLSVEVNQWPGTVGRTPTIIEDTDNGLYRNRSARRTNGISRTQLYSDRWSKRQTLAGIDLSGGGGLGVDFFDGSGGGQSGASGGQRQPPSDFRWPGSTG